eukprot:6179635-Pleurochrysis_carterae.AAC.1
MCARVCAHIGQLVHARASRLEMLAPRRPNARHAVGDEVVLVEHAVPANLELVFRLEQRHARWNFLVELDAANPKGRCDPFDPTGQVIVVWKNADKRASAKNRNIALLSPRNGQELLLNNIAADGVDVGDALRVALLKHRTQEH